MKWGKLFNPVVIGLLKSPLHGIVSSALTVIEYTGRKSGETYQVPVEYVQSDDSRLLVLSRAERVWWRNFREGAEVRLWWRGQPLAATAHATVGDLETFRAAMQTYLTRYPKRAGFFDLDLDDTGTPTEVSLAMAAEKVVVVHVTLAPEAAQSSAAS